MPDAPQKKDWLDRISALATILVPAAIALAGHLIGQGIKEAEIASQDKRASQDRALARDTLRVTQAGLINTLMKSLTSTNSQERKLAVQAVLIALPEDGPTLARTVEQSDEDKNVQAAARASINQRLDSLMQEMFSADAELRRAAAQQLVQGWRTDPAAVQTIIAYATAHPANENGVYNTVVVLTDFSATALSQNRSQVIAFAEQAKKTGSNTAARAQTLLSRVGV
jgi:hypothetical protein